MPPPRKKAKLSTSATENPLYRLAFGDAAEDEATDRDCDRSQTILKRARRKLFNDIINRKVGKNDELLNLLWRQAGYKELDHPRQREWERCINITSGDEEEEVDEEGESQSPASRVLQELEPYPSYHPRGVPRAETKDVDDDEYDPDEKGEEHTGSHLKFRVNLGRHEFEDEDMVETVHYGPSTESDGYLPDDESDEDEDGDTDLTDRWYQWGDSVDPSLGGSPASESEFEIWASGDEDADELAVIDLIAGDDEGSECFV
jgi:hypothetical protein